MITPAETDAGLLAYERVMAFDALQRKRLPLLYGLFTMIFVVMAVAAFLQNMENAAIGCVAAATFSGTFEIWNWRRLCRQNAKNRALLADLRSKYGAALPWLEVERQLAELEKIKLELARGELPPPEES